jgi:hypothetical protein
LDFGNRWDAHCKKRLASFLASLKKMQKHLNPSFQPPPGQDGGLKTYCAGVADSFAGFGAL